MESIPVNWRNWRREFRKMGKKVRSEELDELAHFFDMQHEYGPPTQHSNLSDHKVSKSNQSHGGSGGTKQSCVWIRPNDPCPLHGGTHTWNMSFDYKNGPHFCPPSSNRNNVRHDNHYQDEVNNYPDVEPADDPNSESESEVEEYEDDNPYDHDYNIDSSGPRSDKEPELIPMTFAETKQQNKPFHLSKVLADSGGNRSSIARSSFQNCFKVCLKDKLFSAITLAGAMDQYFKFVHFDKVFLPKYCCSHWIKDVEFMVFDDNGHLAYNAILGRDTLEKASIDVKFSSKEVTWDEDTIPFHPTRMQPICPSMPEDPPHLTSMFLKIVLHRRSH
jgi:hypothetical protein